MSSPLVVGLLGLLIIIIVIINLCTVPVLDKEMEPEAFSRPLVNIIYNFLVALIVPYCNLEICWGSPLTAGARG